MNAKCRMPNASEAGRPSRVDRLRPLIRHSSLAIFFLLAVAPSQAATDASPRALYNEGVAQLRAGKLQQAEAALQTALRSNLEALQPPALYNLGHVRFQQGAAALKDGPQPGPTRARGEAAAKLGDDALRAAEAALAASEVDAIVAAYLQGRGARRELKAAMDAVKRALDSFGTVLRRWQRASGDFKSAHELQPADADARFNAEVVDRHIAQLVDQLNQMMMMMQGMGEQREQLKQKLQQLKGKLPDGMEPGGPGDDEEEEDENGKPKEPQAGTQQAPSRDGREQFISPEDAARLLETLRLDANRKLPVGVSDTGAPQTKTGKTW
jgi:tetratricopeptide (TPR) repeat protein